MDWFKVDKNGLAQLIERRGRTFVVFELLQNAWDQNVTRVDVTLKPADERGYAKLVVEDDDPAGFARLSDAFTLFAPSDKKGDPNQRGRFNLGEKLVLALCSDAVIASTKGTVEFNPTGRIETKVRRERGSCFEGTIRMNRNDLKEVEAAITRLLPPVPTFYNGAMLPTRTPIHTFTLELPTDVADDEGYLRRRPRETAVRLYHLWSGESAYLYEMGIPVVETGDRWHVEIMQKVPLNSDRDNVPPSYLRTVRTAVLNEMADRIETEEDANQDWVREAGGDPRCSDQAIGHILDARFGEKRVAFDPSDPEANKLAVSRGYTVVHGGHLSGGEWLNAKRAGAILPAGQVTPSPKPYSPDGDPQKIVPPNQYTDAIRRCVAYAQRVAAAIIPATIAVDVVNDAGWPFSATYGPGRLTFNLGRLGYGFFTQATATSDGLERLDGLLIHEFGHHFSGDHLAADCHTALTRLGARFKALAAEFQEV